MHSLSAVWLCFIAFAAVFTSGCGGDKTRPLPPETTLTFAFDGLSDHSIHRLHQFDNLLFAATDKGLFIKSTATQSSWQAAGLETAELLDLIVFSKDHYLALTQSTVAEKAVYRLMETTTGGGRWYPVEPDFGGDESEPIVAIVYDSHNQRLFAKGIAVLAVSYDEGRSWHKIAGQWQGAGASRGVIKYNTRTNEVWYGGQNTVGQTLLCTYALDNDDERCFTQALANPGSIYDIAFDTHNPARILVAGAGGVAQSLDQGETWVTLITEQPHRLYTAVAVDRQNPDIIYTGGWDNLWQAPQPLTLEISRDGGVSWTQFLYPSTSLFGGIKSLLAVNENGRNILYIGLHKGGVVKAILP